MRRATQRAVEQTLLAASANARYVRPRRSYSFIVVKPLINLIPAVKREDLMRRVAMLLTVLVASTACSKAETPPADTAAAVVAETPAPIVVALTEADVAGTWKGISMPVGSDSVVANWTQVCANGSCKGTREGSNIVLNSTYTLAGDSSVGVSAPYSDPTFKGGKLIDTWVAHIRGDSVTGTGAGKLASKPDSVVAPYRFSGARAK